MKKILPVLAAVMLLLSSAAAVESLPALPDEEPALPAFATMNEALITVTEPGTCFDTDGTAVVMAMKAGEKYIRLITELDSRAKNLLLRESEAGEVRFDAVYNYVRDLPVSRVEELPELPLDQAELDALLGKTMRELLREGFEPFGVWHEGEEPRARHVIELSYGLYTYSFEFDMTDEDYTEYAEHDTVGNWPVKSVRFNGFSNQTLSPAPLPEAAP